MPKSKYLDYAASATPNPSSIHVLGVEAKKRLETARKTVAELLGARPIEIIFTSGATESNNLAIQGVVTAAEDLWIVPHIVTTSIEHPSVLETCRMLANRKLADLTIVPVEPNGIVDPQKIKKVIKKNTVLVSVMYANNEIGTIQPIRAIAKVIRQHRRAMHMEDFFGPRVGRRNSRRGLNQTLKNSPCAWPVFHVDAVQAANYLDLNVERLGVDLLSLTGSKIEGAGRAGVLYKRKSVSLAKLFGGGDQEHGFRPGTENLDEIIKFANAFAVVRKNYEKENKRLTKLRDYFFENLQKVSRGVLDIGVNGDLENRLPNNVNVTFGKIPSDLIVLELSAKGVMASSKSACKSSSVEGSYVLKAINPKLDSEIGGVRFSLGRDTKKSDIDYTLKALKKILIKLKPWYD